MIKLQMEIKSAMEAQRKESDNKRKEQYHDKNHKVTKISTRRVVDSVRRSNYYAARQSVWDSLLTLLMSTSYCNHPISSKKVQDEDKDNEQLTCGGKLRAAFYYVTIDNSDSHHVLRVSCEHSSRHAMYFPINTVPEY